MSKGGHAIPHADIRRRWPLTHANLAWFATNVHAVSVFDNSVWGVPPRLVARARDGVVSLLDHGALPEVTAALRPLILG